MSVDEELAQVPRPAAEHPIGAGHAVILAGLGTAGALVVGAALLFITASAIVAFHSWPGSRRPTGPARQFLSVAPASAQAAPVITPGGPGTVTGPITTVSGVVGGVTKGVGSLLGGL